MSPHAVPSNTRPAPKSLFLPAVVLKKGKTHINIHVYIEKGSKWYTYTFNMAYKSYSSRWLLIIFFLCTCFTLSLLHKSQQLYFQVFQSWWIKKSGKKLKDFQRKKKEYDKCSGREKSFLAAKKKKGCQTFTRGRVYSSQVFLFTFFFESDAFYVNLLAFVFFAFDGNNRSRVRVFPVDRRLFAPVLAL